MPRFRPLASVVIISGMLVALGCCKAALLRSADVVFVNGRVWTVDEKLPEAEAVAICGDTITEVGSNDEITPMIGSTTRVVDLDGKLMLPGFNDAHTLFGNAIDWFFEVRLFDVDDQAGLEAKLREAVRRVPESMWITGGDWGARRTWHAERNGLPAPEPFHPDLEGIDAITPDHPVLLRAVDGAYFANTAAFACLRITPHTPDPIGGEFEKDEETGMFTGMIRGRAAQRMVASLPPDSQARRLIGARGVLAELRRVGLTSIQDIARIEEVSQKKLYHTNVERSATDVSVFLDLQELGELTVRVYAVLPLPAWRESVAYGVRPRTDDGLVRYGALKSFIDGYLMFEPYEDRPDYSGDFTFRFVDEPTMERDIIEADRAGFDPKIHETGDKALHLLLNWYENAIRENPPRERRFRLVHVWYARQDDLRRAGEMRIIADIQPFHLIREFRTIDEKVGPERAKMAHAWRTMIEHGIRVNLSSDMPGNYFKVTACPVNPLEIMYYAVTRQDLDGWPEGGWHPEQRLTIEEAIEAYTINPAFSSYEDNIKGTITEGKVADMVVLSKDILTVEPRELLSTEVLFTVFGGEIIYEGGES